MVTAWHKNIELIFDPEAEEAIDTYANKLRDLAKFEPTIPSDLSGAGADIRELFFSFLPKQEMHPERAVESAIDYLRKHREEIRTSLTEKGYVQCTHNDWAFVSADLLDEGEIPLAFAEAAHGDYSDQKSELFLTSKGRVLEIRSDGIIQKVNPHPHTLKESHEGQVARWNSLQELLDDYEDGEDPLFVESIKSLQSYWESLVEEEG